MMDDAWDCEEVLELLTVGVGKAQKQRRSRYYIPEDGSRVLTSIGLFPSNHAFGPSWTLQAYQIAGMQLAAAEDLMLSLEGAALGQHVIGSSVLARSALEAMGRAHELLDPTLDARELAAMAMTYEMNSLHRATRLERRRPSGPGSEAGRAVAKLHRQLEGLEKQARVLGFEVIPRKGNRPPAVEKALTSYEDVIHGLLPHGDEPHGLGRVLASAYAAFAHADQGAIRTVRDSRGSDVTNMSQLEDLVLDGSGILAVISPVIFGHLAAYQRQVDAYGWGRSVWTTWARHARFVIRKYSKVG